jgi:hypothetical protein
MKKLNQMRYHIHSLTKNMMSVRDEPLNFLDVEMAQIVNDRKKASDSIGEPIKFKGLREFCRLLQIGRSTSSKSYVVIELLVAKLANRYTNSNKYISRGVRAISI